MNFIEQMKMHDNKIVEVTQLCLDFQIACMLLMQEACQMIKRDEVENGLLILAALVVMRESYNEQRKLFIETFGEKEAVATYNKMGGDKIIYSVISDYAIRCNSMYFDIPPRPQGAEYVCNEALAKKKIQEAMLKHFPMLVQKAA